MRHSTFAGWIVIGLGLVLASCSEGPSEPEPLGVKTEALSEDIVTFPDNGRWVRGQAGLPPASTTSLAFYGIPYALPPVGSLRFAPPKSFTAPPWTGELEFPPGKLGNACPQNPDAKVALADQDESCLNLTVWRPATDTGGPFPVMVWFHGGGFELGSSVDPAWVAWKNPSAPRRERNAYDGSTLAAKGVVVVSIEYRLGALGWLAADSLKGDNADFPGTGNYGLMDAQAGLRWVQDNVHLFGGDKDRVTIFGQSAGGVMVCALMASPMSAGLFHGAISQSGPCSLVMASTERALGEVPRSGEHAVTQLNRRTWIPQNDLSSPALLRGRSADLFVKGSFLFDVPAVKGWLQFMPVVDGFVLPMTIAHAFESGNVMPVPLMVGATSRDGYGFVGDLVLAPGQTWFQANFGQLAPAISAKLPPATNNGKLETQYVEQCAARYTARVHAKNGYPAYLYDLDYDYDSGDPTTKGDHGIEYSLLFGQYYGRQLDPPGIGPSTKDLLFQSLIQGFWTNFAKSGAPCSPEAPCTVEGKQWTAYSGATDQLMNVAEDMVATGMTHTPSGTPGLAADCDKWDEITGRGVFCATGAADCDLNEANGCETDLNANNLNCGACGHSCLGGTCTNGVCAATSVYSGVSGVRGVAVSGTQLFYTRGSTASNGGGLYRGSTGGTAATRISSLGGNNRFTVATDDTHVYWAGGSDGNVYRMPKGAAPDSQITKVIDTNCSHLATLALDADNVYAGCFGPGTIVKAAKTDVDSNNVPRATGHVGVMLGYVREGYLYFGYETGQGKSGVYKVSTTLSGPVFKSYNTAPSTQGIDAIVDDGTNVYWTDAYGATLTRARSDGSGRVTMRGVQAPGDLAGAVALDSTYAYVTLMSSPGSIIKIPIGPLACSAGTADCDKNESTGSNGCESSLNTDSLNCGACGHSCLGGACANGVCAPLPVYSSVPGVRGVAVSGTQLFYTVGGTSASRGLYRGTTSGASAEQISTAGGGSRFAIAVDDTDVYWAGGSDRKVYRLPREAAPMTAPTTVVDAPTCNHLATLALDATNVYAGCFTNGTIVRAPKAQNGPAGAVYSTGHNGVMVGYVRDGFVYFGYETGQGKSGVYKVSTLLDGLMFKQYDTVPSTQGLDALAYDGQNVYWTDAFGTDLTRSRPDGGGRLLMRPAQTPSDLAAGLAASATDPFVYVTLMGSGSIVKIAK